jgi:hypothetical protein
VEDRCAAAPGSVGEADAGPAAPEAGAVDSGGCAVVSDADVVVPDADTVAPDAVGVAPGAGVAGEVDVPPAEVVAPGAVTPEEDAIEAVGLGAAAALARAPVETLVVVAAGVTPGAAGAPAGVVVDTSAPSAATGVEPAVTAMAVASVTRLRRARPTARPGCLTVSDGVASASRRDAEARSVGGGSVRPGRPAWLNWKMASGHSMTSKGIVNAARHSSSLSLPLARRPRGSSSRLSVACARTGNRSVG